MWPASLWTGAIEFDGIYFGEAERFSQYVSEKEVIMITYYPEVNRYQGRENLQVIIQEYR